MPRKVFVITCSHAELDCLATAIGAVNDDHRHVLAGKKGVMSPPKGFWEPISWREAQAIERKLLRMIDAAGLPPKWRKQQDITDAEWDEFFKKNGLGDLSRKTKRSIINGKAGAKGQRAIRTRG